MNQYGCEICIKIPMTFKADDYEHAKERITEVGRSVLNGQFQHSDLVKITAKDLQVVLLRN